MKREQSCAPGANVVEPARAGPGPSHHNRVDERTHREAEEDVPCSDGLWEQDLHPYASADHGRNQERGHSNVLNPGGPSQSSPPAQL